MKRIVLVPLVFLLLLVPVALADCEVHQVKRNLRHILFQYFEDPSSSAFTVDQIRDLLDFYLTIPEGMTNVTCNVFGTRSGDMINNIVEQSNSLLAGIPTCLDGTEYGECSFTKPLYCNNGNLVGECDLCGCSNGATCTNDQCIQNGTAPVENDCVDGTLDGQCSVHQPLKCVNGQLIDDCSSCGCSNNLECNGNSCYYSGDQNPTTCFDTDGGLNENTKGIVYSQNGFWTDRWDTCVFFGDLVSGYHYGVEEYYCDGNSASKMNIPCSDGEFCHQGVCIQPIMSMHEYTQQLGTCIDLDDGIDLSTQSTGDFCWFASFHSQYVVRERYCTPSGEVHGSFFCPSGTYCTNGKCGTEGVLGGPYINNAACIDTDGGLILDVKGFTNPPGTAENHEDYCVDSNTVKEGFCTYNFYGTPNGGWRDEACPTGTQCFDGICIDPPVCGDDKCTEYENQSNCLSDCPHVCGDNLCTGDETPATCSNDCNICGDNLCTGNETPVNCVSDCPHVCGDNLCTGNENPSNCVSDCSHICGDDLCTGDETPATCSSDCGICGDNLCTGPEDVSNCPVDCGICGDNICSTNENSSNCPTDCLFCGDGICTGNETAQNCVVDCAGTCGDDICSLSETHAICPTDCDVIAVTPLTSDSHSQMQPDIDGDNVVYAERVDVFWDVYLLNIATNGKTQITNEVASQSEPRIHNNRIVWTDGRNDITFTDIYMYDISTGQETQITSSDLIVTYNPDVYGNYVVWEDFRNGWPKSDIYAYDLLTGQEIAITNGTTDQIRPRVFNNKVVWVERNSVAAPGDWLDTITNGNIFMYDFSTGQTSQMTFGLQSDYPYIHDDVVVWSEQTDIFTYDFSTDQQKQITNSAHAEQRPVIYDNLIAWIDSRNGLPGSNADIYMYDLSTDTETQITTNNLNQYNPAIYGSKIIWRDMRDGNDGDIYMATIS